MQAIYNVSVKSFRDAPRGCQRDILPLPGGMTVTDLMTERAVRRLGIRGAVLLLGVVLVGLCPRLDQVPVKETQAHTTSDWSG